VIRSTSRLVRTAIAGTALLVLLTAASVRAASRPTSAASISAQPSGPIDVVRFERIVSERYHVRLRRIVAADIDRDGDIDVVASTEHGFMVWMNDGAGHLNRQAPRHEPALAGRSPEKTWKGDESQRDESYQDELPSLSEMTARAHAPPPMVLRVRSLLDEVAYHDEASRLSSPRAPPA
jgi:hypothetical protein